MIPLTQPAETIQSKEGEKCGLAGDGWDRSAPAKACRDQYTSTGLLIPPQIFARLPLPDLQANELGSSGMSKPAGTEAVHLPPSEIRPPQTKLIASYQRQHHRQLPWRESRDYYSVRVSEVMLRQTRVQTFVPYFLRFLKAFPTPEDLAGADTQDPLRTWAGLGAYSRARNLRKAARILVRQHGAEFPRSLSGKPEDRIHQEQKVLNAFRHHRVLRGQVYRRLVSLLRVLNAFRHHRVLRGYLAANLKSWTTSAQRLSASQGATPVTLENATP